MSLWKLHFCPVIFWQDTQKYNQLIDRIHAMHKTSRGPIYVQKIESSIHSHIFIFIRGRSIITRPVLNLC